MEKEETTSEGQAGVAGLRPNRGGVAHVYTLGNFIRGTKERRRTQPLSAPLYMYRSSTTQKRETKRGKICGNRAIRGNTERIMGKI